MAKIKLIKGANFTGLNVETGEEKDFNFNPGDELEIMASDYDFYFYIIKIGDEYYQISMYEI